MSEYVYNQLGKFYNESFYKNQIYGSHSSAIIILNLLYKYYQPRKIIDIGCGKGAWLAVSETLGANTLTGMDGEWVDKSDLFSKNINLVSINLEESMPVINEKFDLCISLEVAEHISEQRAEHFIDLLCSASETVLFSAAVKGQGGTNHINEQMQSYWIDLFDAKGYKCVDLFRPVLWNNDNVEPWYRQNTFLFIGPLNRHLDFNAMRLHEKKIYDIVHPITLASKIEYYENLINELNNKIQKPSLRFCLSNIKRYFTTIFFKSEINKIKL